MGSSNQKYADIWEKDVCNFQAKSGSSGSCPLFLNFIGKITIPEMSGKELECPRCPSPRHPRRAKVQRTPKGGGGGGQKKRGGGAKPHEETPHRKQFPTPLTSVRFAPPPPYSISLSKSLRKSQNSPQLTSSETAFGGSRKMVSDGPSSRGFAFRYVLPPL